MSNYNPDGPDEWAKQMLYYKSALKKVSTKLEILNDEFLEVHHYNPIEHVKSRIKSEESIVRKLRRNGLEMTIDNMRNYVNDVAGLRIICSFTADIYRMADAISNQEDITVITVKNYITDPKSSGYQSYHMIISTPVFLSDGAVDVKVEIQIRTIAMDFWASLEHKIRYKFEGQAPDYIEQQLKVCADIVDRLDLQMEKLNTEIQNYADKTTQQERLDEKQRNDEALQEYYKARIDERLRRLAAHGEVLNTEEE